MRKGDLPDRVNDPNGLVEFEIGTTIGLAPFEDECSILLDEFPDSIEIGEISEIINFDELDVDESDNEEIDEPEETQPSEEPEETEEKEVEEQEESVSEEEEPPPFEIEPTEPEPEVIPKPISVVIGFVCEHALDISTLTDNNGRMIERPFVRLISLPCAGMIKPAWIKVALDEGASGVFVVACMQGSCYHRRGAEITRKRLMGLRMPMLSQEVDRRRIRLFENHPAAKDELLGEIDKFLLELGELDASGVAEETELEGYIEKEPESEEDIEKESEVHIEKEPESEVHIEKEPEDAQKESEPESKNHIEKIDVDDM